MDDEETFTAYHEAGHAVIAYALGATIESVQLGGEADEWLPDRFGECRINWGRVDTRSNWQRQREILSVLAGPVAEMIYNGEPYHPGFVPEWANDWKEAWEVAEFLIPDERQRLAYLERTTSDLYQVLYRDDQWAALAAIVDNLVAHERLDGEEVQDILSAWL